MSVKGELWRQTLCDTAPPENSLILSWGTGNKNIYYRTHLKIEIHHSALNLIFFVAFFFCALANTKLLQVASYTDSVKKQKAL